MNFRSGVFKTAFLILTLSIVPALYGEDRVHIVQRGETFFSIARAQGMRAEDLMRHNGITDPTRLQAGQRLRIPAAAGAGANAPAPAASPATHRVARGETLSGIAMRFSVTVASLRAANNLSPESVLREGVVLRLPSEAVIPAEPAPGGTAAAPSRTIDPSLRWPIVVREMNYMTGTLSGVVITGARAESVRNLARGTVLSAGPYRGFGMVVIVQTDGGYLFVYGGKESLSVREGDVIGAGTELGRLGLDANTNKPKLFLMVSRNNVLVDPARAPRG